MERTHLASDCPDANIVMKVFLSSTAVDLVDYRKAADDTILRLSQDAVVMERFGPLPGEPVAESERKARECDVVVCIVAHRYGYEPEKGRGSITRREVETAKAAGKDVLVWIVADDHPWLEKKEQDLLTDPTVLADPARVAEVAKGVGALIDFKSWLQATFVCDRFTTPDDLGRRIAIALKTHVPTRRRGPDAPKQRRGEVRVVHALQPAPHFHGRDALVEELTDWISDLASPDRVWSLVAAGGTGKTAVAERVVQEMRPGEANVLVWSFYERPEADAFLRECNHLFLAEPEDAPPGGRLERLERGLRDGRPHLIVLDGLERVQEDAGGGRVRGELSDQTLKLLLRALAGGLGRARALVTSRYPLVDLQDWEKRGYRATNLDDLTPEAAVAVLRGWGVVGEDAELGAAAEQVGWHALSVAVIGSYLRSFAGGRVEEVAHFKLDAVTGDDAKAAKLARVLAFYARRLPPEERDLLARLSVFPQGVTVELLAVLVDAGGEVAGELLNAKPRLVNLLNSLKWRGLVFRYDIGSTAAWTAHPFLREKFRDLLGCPTEDVFGVVADSLSAGLSQRPGSYPSDPAVLDHYERLLEATRLAGREQDAFDLYWYGMGSYKHLGLVLGEYQRGYRILSAFSATGRPEELASSLKQRQRSLLANALSLYALQLGRLAEASALRRVDDTWSRSLSDSYLRTGVENSSEVAFQQGRLPESSALAYAAVGRGAKRTAARRELSTANALASRASSAHAMGEIAAARMDFATATTVAGRPLDSLRGVQHARHHLDLGDLDAARALCEQGIEAAHRGGWNKDLGPFRVVLARIDLMRGNDPTAHLDEVRTWTARTGDMRLIIEARDVAALHLLASGDLQGALGEAETGRQHAISCGYGLLHIELLVTLARIRLAWPDSATAVQAAREALDLASHEDCRYAWGEADAAHVWGEAYFANHELPLATRAFKRALKVRRRIGHPGVADTERWLTRCR